MSWIYAVVGLEQGMAIPGGFERTHANPLFVVKLPSLYVAAGGIPETCQYEMDEVNPESGWVVVGLGIDVTEGRAKFMDGNDWRGVMLKGGPWSDSLNGHFAAIRWRGKRFELFTDELGQRELYFGKRDNHIVVSTRLDWVSQATGHAEIDFFSFGSKWLTFNQLGYGSSIVGVERLGPRGHLLVENGHSHKREATPWLPEFANGGIDQAVDTLMSLLRGAMNLKQEVSLGLSGGIDSRLLLACLLSIDRHRFMVHTFGKPLDPDVAISSRIAEKCHLNREYFDETLPDANATMTMLKEYATQACVVEPASSFLKLRYYPAIRQRGKVLIDGGFGEIARRQYLNRVVRFGRNALRARDSSALLPLLRVDRGDIFSQETTSAMLNGAREGLGMMLKGLPNIDEAGVENLVDLLAVRTRIPNYGAPEQSRLDGEVLNFMPLVQPAFLRAVFRANVRGRSNARFYRDLIYRHTPELAAIPLAKAGSAYPFGLPIPLALILTRIRARLGRRFENPDPDILLSHIKEFVLDTAHSMSAVGSPEYDARKVRNAVDSYYFKGNARQKSTIDWWLSFELWRSSLRSHGKEVSRD